MGISLRPRLVFPLSYAVFALQFPPLMTYC